MAKKPRSKPPTKHEAIATRAYEIYLGETRAGDHALEHWLRAEAELNMQAVRRKKKSIAAQRVAPIEPALAAYANPIDAWCSGFEEPERPARIRRRAASLV